MSPYSWWKTYAFALGGYWFNPYMPFGGSSCTSLAQRQSDAIRLAAKVVNVQAELLPMLDDFLIVVPRRRGEAREQNLERGKIEGAKFDNLLNDLNLPKAPEKDQSQAFTTIWYGLEYNSNQQYYGIPEKKWKKIATFVADKFLENDRVTIKDKIDAADLLSVIGKFHHITLVWTRGRPSLYFLWRLFYTASFSDIDQGILHPKKQSLKVSAEARRSIQFWCERLEKTPPPRRKMVRCTSIPKAVIVDILKIKSSPKTKNTILIRMPSAEWWRPERLLDHDYRRLNRSSTTEWIFIWLEALQDSIEAVDVPTSTEVIVVRTNIWQLHRAVERELYVKSDLGAHIAGTIHQLLSRKTGDSNEEKQDYAMELRSILVKGGSPHPLD